MESVTETCVVPVSSERVFQFLSELENLPRWSTQFVKELVTVNGKRKAVTPIGEVFIRLDANPNAGLIDIYAGPDEQHMNPAYLRIIRFSGELTGVTFTFFKWADTDYATWNVFCRWIKIEVENIRKHFS